MGKMTLPGFILIVVLFVIIFGFLSTKITLGPEAAHTFGKIGELNTHPVSLWDSFWTMLDIHWPSIHLF